MSDFDKEAERERLREKYERDKAKREATEQMSDLLLKGATMTNAHCGECGDPIFRHEGQEFCPTCQTVLDDGSAPESEAESATQQDLPDDGPSPAPDTAGGDETKGISSDTSVETPTPDATATSDESGRTTDSAGEAAGDRESPVSAEPRTDQSASSRPATETSATDSHNPIVSGGDSPSSASEPSETESTTGGLAEARASLTRTVTRLARQAEASDDLGRTREYLSAAREAADALAAVKAADR
ncbi:Sjogren's syndrome/scleroderma autoantigen 1 family protein [Haloarculaceae archaeon H-GB2-1]|nr:Sjogren's syndrome/scleroderma autoantigen 1 family protein [Haloarculaceae archaeon H-GB1-1]MEA5406766.1 Sjogren's syndrome/scleroderma autoantigen 1 family protein [Haloarculaceae archaeon H-GB2-1]